MQSGLQQPLGRHAGTAQRRTAADPLHPSSPAAAGSGEQVNNASITAGLTEYKYASTRLAGSSIAEVIDQDKLLEVITRPGAGDAEVTELFTFWRPNICGTRKSSVLQLTNKQLDIMYAVAGCNDVIFLISRVKPQVRKAVEVTYGIDKNNFSTWYKNRGRNPCKSTHPEFIFLIKRPRSPPQDNGSEQTPARQAPALRLDQVPPAAPTAHKPKPAPLVLGRDSSDGYGDIVQQSQQASLELSGLNALATAAGLVAPSTSLPLTAVTAAAAKHPLSKSWPTLHSAGSTADVKSGLPSAAANQQGGLATQAADACAPSPRSEPLLLSRLASQQVSQQGQRLPQQSEQQQMQQHEQQPVAQKQFLSMLVDIKGQGQGQLQQHQQVQQQHQQAQQQSSGQLFLQGPLPVSVAPAPVQAQQQQQQTHLQLQQQQQPGQWSQPTLMGQLPSLPPGYTLIAVPPGFNFQQQLGTLPAGGYQHQGDPGTALAYVQSQQPVQLSAQQVLQLQAQGSTLRLQQQQPTVLLSKSGQLVSEQIAAQQQLRRQSQSSQQLSQLDLSGGWQHALSPPSDRSQQVAGMQLSILTASHQAHTASYQANSATKETLVETSSGGGSCGVGGTERSVGEAHASGLAATALLQLKAEAKEEAAEGTGVQVAGHKVVAPLVVSSSVDKPLPAGGTAPPLVIRAPSGGSRACTEYYSQWKDSAMNLAATCRLPPMQPQPTPSMLIAASANGRSSQTLESTPVSSVPADVDPLYQNSAALPLLHQSQQMRESAPQQMQQQLRQQQPLVQHQLQHHLQQHHTGVQQQGMQQQALQQLRPVQYLQSQPQSVVINGQQVLLTPMYIPHMNSARAEQTNVFPTSISGQSTIGGHNPQTLVSSNGQTYVLLQQGPQLQQAQPAMQLQLQQQVVPPGQQQLQCIQVPASVLGSCSVMLSPNGGWSS